MSKEGVLAFAVIIAVFSAVVPTLSLAKESCSPQTGSFASVEALGQGVEPSLQASGLSCWDRQLASSDQTRIKELHRDLDRLPSAASRKQLAAVIARHQEKLSSGALVVLLAQGEKAKFDAIQDALARNERFAQAYVKFNRAVSGYKSGAGVILCGLRCREKYLKQVERTQGELFAALPRTSIPAPFRQEFEQGVRRVLKAIYQENSARALKSAERATRMIEILEGIKKESRDTVLLGLATVLTGGAMGVVSGAKWVASVAAMERTLMESALLPASSGAQRKRMVLGAAAGAAAGAGLQTARVIHETSEKSEGKGDFFCVLAEELKKQGPAVVRDALVGAVLGGAMGRFAGGSRSHLHSKLPPEVEQHMALRARMLGKGESILPSAAGAASMHAAAGGALVAASKKKPKAVTREVVMVELEEPKITLPVRKKVISTKPGSASRAVQASRPSRHKTEPAAVIQMPERKPMVPPESASKSRVLSLPPAEPRAVAVSAPSDYPAQSDFAGPSASTAPSVSTAPSDSPSAPALFRAKEEGPGKGSGSGLFPSARALAGIEDDYRRRYEGKAAQEGADFYNPEDLRMGSFQRRVIDAVYAVWKYPPDALQTGVTGVTPVAITFDRGGKITNVKMLESSGSPVLDEEAFRALKAVGTTGPLPRSYPEEEYRLILLFEYGIGPNAPRGRLR